MTQQKSDQEKIPSSKGIMGWVREILHLNARDMEDIPPEPSPEVITSLIAKASGDAGDEDGNPSGTGGKGPEDGGEKTEDKDDGDTGKEKESCPYALRRNIVESLREIRKFAEEHDLAAAMVRALLSLLAEMALVALKGKVSASVLDALWKVFNYERQKEEAYRQGELAGRNARIMEEHFPSSPEEAPNLSGVPSSDSPSSPDIFSMARQA